MKITTKLSTGLLLAAVLHAAQADAVLDWNKTAIDAVAAAKLPAPMTTRAMAITHAAMFDAVNAIDGRYAASRTRERPPAGASAEAAACGAAHAVLVRLFPQQQPQLDAALGEAVAALPASAARGPSAEFGAAIGADAYAWRADDGTDRAGAYRPHTSPGRYVPTTLPVFGGWALSKTWVMQRPDQFRPAPPTPLGSAQWAADYNEIKSLGGKASSARSAPQTEAALFWQVIGAPSWNPIVRELASRGARDLARNARLFALVYLAAADSLVAVVDAKYAYEFWRPITAIRNGDIDGNPATTPDIGWTPLIDTPMHPEYPCAHCINAAAVGAVLEAEFGRGTLEPFSMQSPTLPGITRHWTRIADYVAEVSDARVWSGVHFRNSTRVGETMGRAIGELAVRERR